MTFFLQSWHNNAVVRTPVSQQCGSGYEPAGRLSPLCGVFFLNLCDFHLAAPACSYSTRTCRLGKFPIVESISLSVCVVDLTCPSLPCLPSNVSWDQLHLPT